jgi:3-methyladenine DNA glycosylase AlkC
MDMRILDDDIETRIDADLVHPLLNREYERALESISPIVRQLHANIPQKKRVSYGIVYVVNTLSEHLHSRLSEAAAPTLLIASALYDRADDCDAKGVALGVLSLHGLSDFGSVLPYFESAAASSDWQVREFSQMSFRRLIRAFPNQAKHYLIRLALSHDANLRRFVAETLRPVRDNRWFLRDSEYPLSILRTMFSESSPYARTSVGNNLSDLAHHHPELIYSIVDELVNSGDPNSYWIAYRACRNLVKREPVRVMRLLRVDVYHYKDRAYRLDDYHRD